MAETLLDALPGEPLEGIKEEFFMEDAAARDPLQGASASGRSGSLVCGACAERIDREQPVLYELLLNALVETVQVPAGGWIEPPADCWPVGVFHVDCYETLVASLGHDDGVRYVGCCALSSRSMSAPRPLSQRPLCASPIELAQTHAPFSRVA